ncbi:unnamed protein product [Spodoptera exigua]|nr:unnamed protein product [Spodoptera exigua]
MIDVKHLKEYKLDKEKYKFEELDKMAERENLKVSKLRAKIVKQPYEANLHTISVKGNNNKTKLTTSPEPRLITKTSKRQIEPENDEDYDYDELVNEYNEEAINESRSSNAYHISKAVTSISQYGIWDDFMTLFSFRSTDATNCSYEEGIGLIAVKCLIEDYVNHRQTLREVMGRLWRIFLIWFLVYLAVAIPLWCTRGKYYQNNYFITSSSSSSSSSALFSPLLDIGLSYCTPLGSIFGHSHPAPASHLIT